MLRVQRLAICSRLLSASTSTAFPEFNKTEQDGIAHVTSINVSSGDRSIVQLSRHESKRIRRFRKEFHLPPEAVTGLRQVLLECKTTPKQLQHEADQMAEKLAQRRFPAPPDVVKKAREQIKKTLMKGKEDDGFDDILGDDKVKKAREHELRNKVNKMLKKSRYNWRPLEFETKEAAATYALARITPNYAEIARCLEELPDCEPQSVLDFGSGSGAGYWAVKERFPQVKEICMVDTSDQMTKLAMDIMRNEEGQVDQKVQFRRHVLPSLQTTYDVVIGHRFLSEMGSFETRMATVEALWARTNRYLILIESALEDSFEALLDVRDYLLTAGTTVDRDATFRLLQERRLATENVKSILNSRNLSEMERFDLLREALPDDVQLPTTLPTATVVAPCPHDLGCPLRGTRTPCSYQVRWRPIRADGKSSSRMGDGTETGKFTFVVLEKGRRQHGGQLGRILKMRKMKGHATCDICTAFRGIQRLTVSKRAGSLYQAVKSRRDGELFPLEMETKATEGMFDLYECGSDLHRTGDQ